FVEGRRLADEAVAVGYPLRGADAVAAHVAQMSPVNLMERSLGALLPALDAFVAQYPGIGGWDAARAWILAETGRRAEALEEVERMAGDGFEAVSRDTARITALALLGWACFTARESKHAARLYAMLVPHAGCQVVGFAWFAGGVASGAVE